MKLCEYVNNLIETYILNTMNNEKIEYGRRNYTFTGLLAVVPTKYYNIVICKKTNGQTIPKYLINDNHLDYVNKTLIFEKLKNVPYPSITIRFVGGFGD